MNISPSTEPVARFGRAGFALPLDILIAPARAFDRIAARPQWLWAYGVVVAAALASVALIAPAIVHVATVAPQSAGVKTADPGLLRELVATLALQNAVLRPLLMVGLTATVLTVVARFKGKTVPATLFVSLATACLVPWTLGSLVEATLIGLRDPRSFSNVHALIVAVPDNLGVFASPKNDAELGFLAHFDVFGLWSHLLLAFGMARFAGVRLVTALATAFGLDFVFALIF